MTNALHAITMNETAVFRSRILDEYIEEKNVYRLPILGQSFLSRIPQRFELNSITTYLLISRSFKNETFVCASIKGSGEMTNSRTGLVSGHAYTVTGAKKVSV